MTHTAVKIRRYVSWTLIFANLLQELLAPISYLPQPLAGIRDLLPKIDIISIAKTIKPEQTLACESGCTEGNVCDNHEECPTDLDWQQGYWCDCSAKGGESKGGDGKGKGHGVNKGKPVELPDTENLLDLDIG